MGYAFNIFTGNFDLVSAAAASGGTFAFVDGTNTEYVTGGFIDFIT